MITLRLQEMKKIQLIIEYIDIRISPVISESENSYSISSAPLAVHQTTNPFIKSGKTATNVDSQANAISIK